MNNKFLLIIIAIIVLLGGFFLFNNKTKNNQVNQNTTQQTVAKPTPAVIQSTTVTITNSGFNPQILTIKAGTKVVWTNKSGTEVTVNSDSHPTHLLYPFLNLGGFNDGESVGTVITKPGTYTYHNHLNPDQTGKIIAE